MSTKAEIERMPERCKRCTIQLGVVALASTPSITRAKKRPQSAGASMRTVWMRPVDTGTVGMVNVLCSHWVKATTSRAMPLMPKQSARLGVIFKVNKASFKAK